MHALPGHGRQVEGLGSRGISREGCVWSGGGPHGTVSVLGTEDTGGSAGGALLVGRGRLGYLALQRGLLLRAEDVPDVVWRPRAAGMVGRSHMAVVRRAPCGVGCSRIEGRVLGEVVAPVAWVHCSGVPVHPGAGGGLMVLDGVLGGVPVLSADSAERWWRGGVELHCWVHWRSG